MTVPVTEFLTVDDALEVARLVTGEPARVRDFGDLHAALARPQQTEGGRELFPGIWDKAAALMESLGHSYALVDGNKRLTWNATWFFLGVNGHPLAEPLDEEAAFQFMLRPGPGQADGAGHRGGPAGVRRLRGAAGRYCRVRLGAPSRRTNFWIFPVAVFGSSVTNVTPRGALK